MLSGNFRLLLVTGKRGYHMEKMGNVIQHEFTENAQPPKEAVNQQGKILRVKQGYNPNSSSIGSIIFVMPAALLGITAAFGAVSGVIMSKLLADKPKITNPPTEGDSNE